MIEDYEPEKGILLGRCECRSIDFLKNEEEGMTISGFDIKVSLSKGFKSLVQLIDDEETERHISILFEEDMVTEAKEFLGGLNVLICENDENGVPMGTVGVAISCILTPENTVSVDTERLVHEMLENMSEDSRKVLISQIEGLEKMYEKYYSIPFREDWGHIINLMFNEPEKCGELLTEHLG